MFVCITLSSSKYTLECCMSKKRERTIRMNMHSGEAGGGDTEKEGWGGVMGYNNNHVAEGANESADTKIQ